MAYVCLIDPFHNDASSLKFFKEHHLPRFNVDRNLKSVHYSQQPMKLFCTCSCNIKIRCRFRRFRIECYCEMGRSQHKRTGPITERGLERSGTESFAVVLGCFRSSLRTDFTYVLRRSEGKASVKSAKRREILTSDRLKSPTQ